MLRVGIGIPDKDTVITSNWANGIDPVVKCFRMAAHYVQEYSTLPFWLPKAYTTANPPKAVG